MIQLTEKAAAELRSVLARKEAPAGTGLRLGISRGGCAGMQYVMAVQAAEAGDETVESRGVLLHVAADSIEFLRGCEIDYSDALSDSGFKIVNPNAARSCGCGTSFEAKVPGREPVTDSSDDGVSCGGEA